METINDKIKEIVSAYKADIHVCDKDDTKTDISKNTILYRPPGTGKTYHTVNYTVAKGAWYLGGVRFCSGQNISPV